MPAKEANARRLYQQVADQIAALIAHGNFEVGSRLPPERDLALRFQVSRPTVREALVALEIAGFVAVRTGSGAYVCRRQPDAPGAGDARIEAGPSAFELIAARRAVEPAVAAMAATAAGKKDLQRIAEAHALCERHWQGTHWEMLEADRLFHRRIAEATHNDTLARIVERLWDDMFSPIFAVMSERTLIKDKKMLTMHDHRTIIGCIERRDATGAEAAMRAHLVHAEMKLLQSAGADAEAMRPARKRAPERAVDPATAAAKIAAKPA